MGSRVSTLRKKRDKSSPSPDLPVEVPLRLRARVARTAHDAALYDKVTGEPIKVADAMNVAPRSRPYDHIISPLAQNPPMMFAERPSTQDGGRSEGQKKQSDLSTSAMNTKYYERNELNDRALGFHALTDEDLEEEAADQGTNHPDLTIYEALINEVDDQDEISSAFENNYQPFLWSDSNRAIETTRETAAIISNPVFVNSVRSATTEMMSPTRSVYPRISVAETASVASLDADPYISQFSIADTASILSWAPGHTTDITDIAIRVATGRHSTFESSTTTEDLGVARTQLSTSVERRDLHYPDTADPIAHPENPVNGEVAAQAACPVDKNTKRNHRKQRIYQ